MRSIVNGPRWLNVGLGGLLIAIAFAIDDTDSARANSAIAGAWIITVALYAVVMPALRWLNTAMALWLLISAAFVFDHASTTAKGCQVFIALVVFIVSIGRDSIPRHRAPA